VITVQKIRVTDVATADIHRPKSQAAAPPYIWWLLQKHKLYEDWAKMISACWEDNKPKGATISESNTDPKPNQKFCRLVARCFRPDDCTPTQFRRVSRQNAELYHRVWWPIFVQFISVHQTHCTSIMNTPHLPSTASRPSVLAELQQIREFASYWRSCLTESIHLIGLQ